MRQTWAKSSPTSCKGRCPADVLHEGNQKLCVSHMQQGVPIWNVDDPLHSTCNTKKLSAALRQS